MELRVPAWRIDPPGIALVCATPTAERIKREKVCSLVEVATLAALSWRSGNHMVRTRIGVLTIRITRKVKPQARRRA